MHLVEIMDGIYWVGVIDWNIKDFHGYSTEKGTTYNSFLVIDDKVTLFDTVRKEKSGELWNNINSIIQPGKIDYVVVNHVEPDHSGALPELVERVRPKKIICSVKGKEALIAHYHRADWPYHVVRTGDEICLGKKTVRFIETRMIHWPDSMFSYLVEDRVLISNDGFGQHWATSQRFDDEVDFCELMKHAAKYYANILMLYSSIVQRTLNKLTDMNLGINMILTDHGLIWRKHVTDILEAYDRWSKHITSRKTVVIYDSMWHSTEMMAQSIVEGVLKQGISVKVFDLKSSHRSDIMTDILESKAVAIGSPTLNNGMMPLVADMMNYMRGLKPLNRIGAAFGSYGWSGESVKLITEMLATMKMQIVDPVVSVQYVPDKEILDQCVILGENIGKAVKQTVIK